MSQDLNALLAPDIPLPSGTCGDGSPTSTFVMLTIFVNQLSALLCSRCSNSGLSRRFAASTSCRIQSVQRARTTWWVTHPENRTRDCFGRRCGAGDCKDCGAERNNLTHNPSHGPPPSGYCRICTLPLTRAAGGGRRCIHHRRRSLPSSLLSALYVRRHGLRQVRVFMVEPRPTGRTRNTDPTDHFLLQRKLSSFQVVGATSKGPLVHTPRAPRRAPGHHQNIRAPPLLSRAARGRGG
ncbi:hypothetical protein M2405_004056 [Rhodococcus erythropolis]|nr:hypothetical protein [Rhodococcus erythropolis]MCW2425268.1 hypothetical protein [Rhodococcus erythropolis]